MAAPAPRFERSPAAGRDSAASGAADRQSCASGPSARELALRQVLPVFVNSYNQLTFLKDTLAWFDANGFENVTIVDQASDYPPLLERYQSQERRELARLMRLPSNVGPRRALDGIARIEEVPHIFTDPDLSLPEPAHARFLCRLFELGRRHSSVKIGLALDISRPERFRDVKYADEYGNLHSIADWERQFWKEELEADVYRANVDTTFYLWRPGPQLSWQNLRRRLMGRPLKKRCLRVAGEGFVCQHRPWLLEDDMPSEESCHYKRSSSDWNTWR